MATPIGAQLAPHLPQRVTDALALRAQGYSWRAVAAALGESDHADIYQLCRAHDAAMRNEDRWRDLTAQAMDLAQEAGAQLGEALRARELSPSQLPVVYGITQDKVINMRRADIAASQAKAPADAGAMLADVLARLQAGGGGSASVTLEVHPASSPAPITLDVSPSK